MAADLKITLALYEGPLDLLLDLIRRQKIAIYDIPIADVTAQYLDYLHLMDEMDVDVAAEFLVIAAQLIYIKSRMLLPPDPDARPEEEEDPRTELVRRLLEYEKFKNAAEMLYQRELVEKAAWTRPGSVEIDPGELEPGVTATLFDMIDIFRDVLKRFEERPSIEFVREEITIEEMANFMLTQLRTTSGGIRFTQLMERLSSRQALITAFLALLELVRLRAIKVGQKHAFGDIQLRANPKYERSESFSLA